MHLIVLVHGLHGTVKDFGHVRDSLERRFPAAMVRISVANEWVKTRAGIDTGGQNLAKEIHTWLWEAADATCETQEPIYLTLIGHSLGGLFSRNAISRLVNVEKHPLLAAQAEKEHGELGVFRIPSSVVFHSLITLCSPHLGSRRPEGSSFPRSIWRKAVHATVSNFFGRSGKQLLMMDEGISIRIPSEQAPSAAAKRGGEEEERLDSVEEAAGASSSATSTGSGPSSEDTVTLQETLLARMTDPAGVYVACLMLFKHRTLVSMTECDITVPYAASSGVARNPYTHARPIRPTPKAGSQPNDGEKEEEEKEEEEEERPGQEMTTLPPPFEDSKAHDGKRPQQHEQDAPPPYTEHATPTASAASVPSASVASAFSQLWHRAKTTAIASMETAKTTAKASMESAKATALRAKASVTTMTQTAWAKATAFKEAPAWTVAGTCGFTEKHMAVLAPHLSPAYVDEDKEGRVPDNVEATVDEMEVAGKDEAASERKKMKAEEEAEASDGSSASKYKENPFGVDERRTLEYDNTILARFNTIPWRRIDLDYFPSNVYDHVRAHDFPVGKRQRPEALAVSLNFIEVLTSIVGVDMEA